MGRASVPAPCLRRRSVLLSRHQYPTPDITGDGRDGQVPTAARNVTKLARGREFVTMSSWEVLMVVGSSPSVGFVTFGSRSGASSPSVTGPKRAWSNRDRGP